ncbi:MAG: peptidylprolyl isomerase [Candidatus Marinimicrobia bacterium]|jgi:peptidyl-prolyl cis-trans isomerase B (cyclophilin B)|nr:peptidylprolyl isomerase [Candidatus Neomarinimicrobiota bacterium]MBT3501164.1 peptidylprolyl isomerase [Candidatus Neomarinimicrobiota bacterium]MBT3840114.1 peptidylprolyl isomerase [Candidatus Neomarinimicrobiota bacterium]MBT3999991.1 peptidylprolyl isomerase [Candidatus Neomarinimicrobiota bacterium]MBT4282967.1 peptidylprolyl isomerase [Candidatus Neomarinimicrobiota bacterium]
MKKIITQLIIIGAITVSCETPQKDVAIISTQFGEMVVEFFDEAAPKHVESFKTHAESGYYNGSIFHRVIPGFVIQGGDPNTKGDNKSMYGMGGYAAKYFGVGDEDDPKSWNIPAEFNDIKHRHGILSMARSGHPDSGGSQFFVCAGDVPNLDGQYTVFGQVIEGQEVIDRIVSLPRDGRDNPDQRVEMQVRMEKRDK